ncbi:hypothetical protein GCM10027175_05820 [Hymenobacter latericoloratus]
MGQHRGREQGGQEQGQGSVFHEDRVETGNKERGRRTLLKIQVAEVSGERTEAAKKPNGAIVERKDSKARAAVASAGSLFIQPNGFSR